MCCYLCSAFLRMARGAGGFLFSLDFLLIPTVGLGGLHVCMYSRAGRNSNVHVYDIPVESVNSQWSSRSRSTRSRQVPPQRSVSITEKILNKYLALSGTIQLE